MSSKHFPWLIVLIILSATAGALTFQPKHNTTDASPTAASSLGIIATPQSTKVEGLPKGTSSRVQFTLKNAGKRTVRVQTISTSCGCSVAEPMANQTIRPGKSESLFISATPPPVGNRIVHISLKLVDLDDASRDETIRLELNLIGQALAPLRVYELPTVVEMAEASGQVVRQLEFKTVEENANPAWITGVSSTSNQISAEILDSVATVRQGGGVQRTYSLRLTAEVPQREEIVAGTIRLMSGSSAVDDSAAIRVIVRRRVPFEAFPSVIRLPINTVEETTRSVIIQAADIADVESLWRLEVSDTPNQIDVKWLPEEERSLRRLRVKILSGHRNSLPPIALRDPQSTNSLAIQFIAESE